MRGPSSHKTIYIYLGLDKILVRGVLALLCLIALLVPLAGCTSSLSEKNFTLRSREVGFDKGGTASFNLTYDPRALPGDASYTLDRKYAVEHAKYDRVGGFMSEFETDDARADLDMRFYVDGHEVDSYVFNGNNRSVEIRLKVPQDLATDTYVLALSLFQVGEVESNEFRIASP